VDASREKLKAYYEALKAKKRNDKLDGAKLKGEKSEREKSSTGKSVRN
jgi:hypothetical protein